MNVTHIIKGGLINHTGRIIELSIHVEVINLIRMVEVVQHL